MRLLERPISRCANGKLSSNSESPKAHLAVRAGVAVVLCGEKRNSIHLTVGAKDRLERLNYLDTIIPTVFAKCSRSHLWVLDNAILLGGVGVVGCGIAGFPSVTECRILKVFQILLF